MDQLTIGAKPRCLSSQEVAEGQALAAELRHLQGKKASVHALLELRVAAFQKLQSNPSPEAIAEYQKICAENVLIHPPLEDHSPMALQGLESAARITYAVFDRAAQRYLTGRCVPWAKKILTRAVEKAQENLMAVTSSESERVRRLAGRSLTFSDLIETQREPLRWCQRLLAHATESDSDFPFYRLVKALPELLLNGSSEPAAVVEASSVATGRPGVSHAIDFAK